MILGDTINYQGKTWLVRKIDSQTQTAFIVADDGTEDGIGIESDVLNICRVLCNPSQSWPFVLVPQTKGRILAVERATINGSRPLQRNIDWVKMDEWQMGGPIFMSPGLNLGYRDRLILSYANKRVPVDIPRDFKPMAKKLIPQNKVGPVSKPITRSLYDRLKEDDFE